MALADESYVFGSSSCTVLAPEGEVGPYYVPGEYIRSDLITGETGVDGVSFITDIQLINVNTCEPIVDAWADVWNWYVGILFVPPTEAIGLLNIAPLPF